MRRWRDVVAQVASLERRRFPWQVKGIGTPWSRNGIYGVIDDSFPRVPRSLKGMVSTGSPNRCCIFKSLSIQQVSRLRP